MFALVVPGGVGRPVLPTCGCCLRALPPACPSPGSYCNPNGPEILEPLLFLLWEFQSRMKEGREGDLDTRACLKGEQPGLCSLQIIPVPSALDPAAKTSQPCQDQPILGPAGPQLRELSGSCSQPGALMFLRMKRKEE